MERARRSAHACQRADIPSERCGAQERRSAQRPRAWPRLERASSPTPCAPLSVCMSRTENHIDMMGVWLGIDLQGVDYAQVIATMPGQLSRAHRSTLETQATRRRCTSTPRFSSAPSTRRSRGFSATTCSTSAKNRPRSRTYQSPARRRDPNAPRFSRARRRPPARFIFACACAAAKALV